MKRLLFWTSIAAAAMTSTATIAACPTPESLRYGVFVTYDDESYSRLTSIGENTILEDLTYTDSSGQRHVYVNKGGILTTRSMEIEAGEVLPSSVIDTEFTGGAIDIARMKDGGELFLEFSRTSTEGREIGKLLIEKAEATDIEIGACGYVAHPVTVTERSAKGTHVTRYFWLPTFEIAILRQIVQEEDVFDFQALKIDDDFPRKDQN